MKFLEELIGIWRRLQAGALFFLACSSVSAQWGREPDGGELERYTRASIVFATHDLSAPVSAFGHTFLVLHSDAVPEPQALVLEFGGITTHALDYFRALVDDIEGGFTLSFMSYKEHQYFTEGRSLWVYPLILDDAALVALKQQIRASSGKRARYTFARWNCSHYVLDLVAKAAGIDRARPEVPFVVPAVTLRWLRKHGLLGIPVFRESPGSRAQAAYNNLSASDKARLRSVWLDPDQGLEEPISTEVKQAISVSAEHWMLHEIQPNRRDAWFRLKRRFPLTQKGLVPPFDPASNRSTGEWVLHRDFRGDATAIGWRLGFLSLAGEERTGLRNAGLQLLAIDIERRNGHVRLARANVLAMEANAPGDLYFADFTQRLDLGYVDDRTRLDRISQRFLVRFGRGVTWRLMDVDVSLLPALAGGAANGGAGWEPVVSIGFRASIYVPLPRQWRAKISSEWSGRELAGVRSSHRVETASPVLRGSSTLSLVVDWRNQQHREASVGLLWAYRMQN